MPIAKAKLIRRYVDVDERTTVGQVVELVLDAGKIGYIVVRRGDRRFAVLRLDELLDALEPLVAPASEAMLLDAPLDALPALLDQLTVEGLEQSRTSMVEAMARLEQLPGRRFVVVSGSAVLGILPPPGDRPDLSLAMEARLRRLLRYPRHQTRSARPPMALPEAPPAADRRSERDGTSFDTRAPADSFGTHGASVPTSEPAPAGAEPPGEMPVEPAPSVDVTVAPPAPSMPPPSSSPPMPAALGGEDQALPPAVPVPRAPAATKLDHQWVNVELADHDRAEPLALGEDYVLVVDIDTMARASALAHQIFEGGPLNLSPQDEEITAITVQLASEDFEIFTEPQQLRVPRKGRSKNKARFDVKPKCEGTASITVLLLKDGNFIQAIIVKLQVGHAAAAGAFSSDSIGRPLNARTMLQPRDVNLTIVDIGTGFQVILNSAVCGTALLPIKAQQLDQMIADVRKELQEVVHLAGRMYQTRLDIPPEVDELALPKLARAGFRLYQRLFFGPAAGSDARLLGSKLREMACKQPLKIQISSQHFLLPWGILYLAETFDPDHIDPELVLGFKHIVEHIPLQRNMQVVDDTITPRPVLRVGLNVNPAIDQKMGHPFVSSQIAYWQAVEASGQAMVVVRRSEDEVRQALADTTTPDQLLYFLCHAVSKSLAEGSDSSTIWLTEQKAGLTLADLSIFAPADKTLPGAPLVFINACESAELSPLLYDGFVPYFMDKGARGVIGTECETPAIFAVAWAQRFFDEFLRGRPLGEVMLDLRREFYARHRNLLGLLYALYCDGDTRIVPGLRLTPAT